MDDVSTSRVARTKVFISYAHQDAKYLTELNVFLRRLERERLVDSMRDVWMDTDIHAGEIWEEGIRKAITEARVAVLLLSQAYLASPFIWNVELPLILGAAEHGGLRVLPVVVGPCTFRETPSLARLQAINDPEWGLKPLRPFRRQKVWIKLVNEIRTVLIHCKE